MNKISKEKRNQLIMVAAGIAVVVAGIYWGLIRAQYQNLADLAAKKADKVAELQRRRAALKMAVENANDYKRMTTQLVTDESDIATGDYYAWSYDLIRRFKTNYKVEIPTVTEPTISDVDILPQFPYRQIRLTINGKAFYHDLGKFLADFENTYPHIRVTNLSMDPAPGGGPDAEKLAFHFEIVALVKPNS
jgi:hypothetical protein